MINLVLITSVIKTPNKPLSYINTRSIYTHQERFEQTKKTIQSIREKIPNAKIFIVECSNLDDEQNEYLKNNCDYFLNLINKPDKVENIYSISKALGEGTMTIEAINYIKENNIDFDSLFKITGRYWLSNNFNYKNFENNNIIVHYIQNNINNTCTSLYKINKINVLDFQNFLIQNKNLMYSCIGYEVLFAMFLKLPKNNKIIHLNKIGVNGYISVSNDFVDN
jgi:hypothetical protein